MRLFLGLSLLFFGCTDGDSAPIAEDSAAAPVRPMTVSEVPSLDVHGHGGARLGPVVDRPSPEVRDQLMRDMMASRRLQVDLSGRLNEAPNWRAMEAAADEIVPRLLESTRANAEVDVAERIVRTIVALPSPSPDDFDALGEYTQTLVRYRSAEGDDILRALIRLEGVWSPEQIAAAARTAARNLGAHFTDQAQCVGCTVEEALAGMLPQKRMSLDPYLYEVQTVHRELVRLAQSGALG